VAAIATRNHVRANSRAREVPEPIVAEIVAHDSTEGTARYHPHYIPSDTRAVGIGSDEVHVAVVEEEVVAHPCPRRGV
jgi:hypothetical protein